MTALPPLAVLLLITLAPVGSVICSACTVATTVELAAKAVDAPGPPQQASTPITRKAFRVTADHPDPMQSMQSMQSVTPTAA
jgi:hypothetical protein